MPEAPTVAVLIACHNRREKTLTCLERLKAQTAAADLRVHVFDDASTDDTVEAVRAQHPDVEIIAGSGQAFWAGGMRAAFLRALAGDADFYLWLNDDVQLAPDAIGRLLSTHGEVVAARLSVCLIGGAVAEPKSGLTSYGGVDRSSRLHPLRFRPCAPAIDAIRFCDTLVGNVVLVPRATVQAIGVIDAVFTHTLGDLDYGLRVSRAGGCVALAPGHVGLCERNRGGARWFNPDLSLRDRWRVVSTPLGLPFGPWFQFARRHGGPLWPLFLLLPYWRLLAPVAAIRVCRSLRAGLHHDRRRASHAGAS